MLNKWHLRLGREWARFFIAIILIFKILEAVENAPVNADSIGDDEWRPDFREQGIDSHQLGQERLFSAKNSFKNIKYEEKWLKSI